MARSDDRFPRELGAFFKVAASALDDVKEQVVRGGQVGKATLDAQLLKRQRDKALQKLTGEAHSFGGVEKSGCALSEAFADFFAVSSWDENSHTDCVYNHCKKEWHPKPVHYPLSFVHNK